MLVWTCLKRNKWKIWCNKGAETKASQASPGCRQDLKSYAAIYFSCFLSFAWIGRCDFWMVSRRFLLIYRCVTSRERPHRMVWWKDMNISISQSTKGTAQCTCFHAFFSGSSGPFATFVVLDRNRCGETWSAPKTPTLLVPCLVALQVQDRLQAKDFQQVLRLAREAGGKVNFVRCRGIAIWLQLQSKQMARWALGFGDEPEELKRYSQQNLKFS